jgi:nitrous oxide reductase accessory protein NosL
MRALLITAAAVSATLMLAGCRNRGPEPLPGPRSAAALRASDAAVRRLLQSQPVGPVAQRLVQGTHRQGAFAWKRAKWTG